MRTKFNNTSGKDRQEEICVWVCPDGGKGEVCVHDWFVCVYLKKKKKKYLHGDARREAA